MARNPTGGKPGRRSRYSKRMHARLVKAARQGMTFTAAAQACGIPIETLRSWFGFREGLRADMEQAIEDGWLDLARDATNAIQIHFDRHAENPKTRIETRLVEAVMKRVDPRFREAYQSKETVAPDTADREKIAALDEAMKRDV